MKCLILVLVSGVELMTKLEDEEDVEVWGDGDGAYGGGDGGDGGCGGCGGYGGCG